MKVQRKSTEPSKETPEQQDARIDVMLGSMVVETALWCLRTGQDLPCFTRQQIGDYCGCSKETIRRIEERALCEIKGQLTKSK